MSSGEEAKAEVLLEGDWRMEVCQGEGWRVEVWRRVTVDCELHCSTVQSRTVQSCTVQSCSTAYGIVVQHTVSI